MRKIIIVLIFISLSVWGNNNEKDWDFTIDSSSVGNKEEIKKDKIDNQSDDKEDDEDNKEEKEKDEGMDFSDVKLQSDSLDEDEERQEEKEIDEILRKEKKPQIDIKEVKLKEKLKKEKKDFFLSFLKLQLKLNYRNLMLFDNLPYGNSFGAEFTTSIMGIELKGANAYIGEIGYRLAYNSELSNILIISPLMLNFELKRYGQVFPIEVNLFKMYFFQKTIRGNNKKNLNTFFEYVSVSLNWQYFKDKTMRSSVFLGISFAPDDINSNPQREAVVFTIGIKGDFLPIKIYF